MNTKCFCAAITAILLALCLCSCSVLDDFTNSINSRYATSNYTEVVKNTPEYIGYPYIIVNDNQPLFSKDELTTTAYEHYSELDELGRCGVASACLGKELMPTSERTEINQVRPTGWRSVKYDFIEGKYLYNRCHLIGYQLTGENINAENLITGTRYLNNETMLPFEEMIANYIIETGNHVAYRVTPVFIGKNLVASGVQIEAYSIEDDGYGVTLNVYCFNVQPGVIIDYKTGDSRLDTEPEEEPKTESSYKNPDQLYIIDSEEKLFHKPGCEELNSVAENNKRNYIGIKSNLDKLGFYECQKCNP